MVKRNPNFRNLESGYLFVEIAHRRAEFSKCHPNLRIISLGIGDTTEPIPPHIAHGLVKRASEMTTIEGYSGYPEYNGSRELRQAIVDTFYPGLGITPDEVFISDGSKPDLARLQLLFHKSATIAIQDPVYPAYVDASIISGRIGDHEKVYLSCTPENGFFPDLTLVQRTDLIFFCSPNNPTGAAATKQQLTELVNFAKKNKSIIVFDSAYSVFISDLNCPTSIYSIEGAHEVAFEISSFSKLIGFTGVRLGWTVCPTSLKFEDGTPVLHDWARIMGTCFNGASTISESGGLAALKPHGKLEMEQLSKFYLENARIIKTAMKELGFQCYGGTNSPYIWIRIPGQDSWTVFQNILEKAYVITTPGVGFGKGGENYIRISSFAHREDVKEAVNRLKYAFKKI